MIYMKEEAKKNKILMIRMTENQHEAIRIEAFERNISRADLIRQSVAFFIKTFSREKI